VVRTAGGLLYTGPNAGGNAFAVVGECWTFLGTTAPPARARRNA